MSKIIIVIPARYGSTRLPGKPLIKINGIEMIKRVADIAAEVCSQFPECSYLVATDDVRITKFCDANDIPSVMTSEQCKSGTDRSWDAIQSLEERPELIINLQGDNPLCPPWFISALIQSWKEDNSSGVYTPYVSLTWKELDELREAKKTTPYSGTTVQIDKAGHALTFSKTILPTIRKEQSIRKNADISPVKRHIGLYAYTFNALEEFFKWDAGIYEECEGLEQMRFLENCTTVKMVKVYYKGRKGMSGVDSHEDIERAEKILNNIGN